MDAYESKAIEYANYILENHTVEEASKHYGLSRKATLKYLALLTDENSLYYNESLANKILLTRAKLILKYRALAGSKSKRKAVLSEEDIVNCIVENLYEGTSSRELAKKYGCSHTSIINGMKKVASTELMLLIQYINSLRKRSKEYFEEEIKKLVINKLMNGDEEYHKILNIITDKYSIGIIKRK